MNIQNPFHQEHFIVYCVGDVSSRVLGYKTSTRNSPKCARENGVKCHFCYHDSKVQQVHLFISMVTGCKLVSGQCCEAGTLSGTSSEL